MLGKNIKLLREREEGEEYNMEKRKRGSNNIFPIILRLLGRISRGEGGLKFGE